MISVPVKSYPQLLVDEVGLSLGLAPGLAWMGYVTLARGLPSLGHFPVADQSSRPLLHRGESSQTQPHQLRARNWRL